MKNKNYYKTPSKEKALLCLNKLNNYSKLPVDHRWVSIIRHYLIQNVKKICPHCKGKNVVIDGYYCNDCDLYLGSLK